MSAAPLKLEYELTPDEMREGFQRHFSRVRSRSWGHKLGVCFFLYLTYSLWSTGSWWAGGLALLMAMHLLLFDWWLIRWLSQSRDTFRFGIETDDRGIRFVVPHEKTSPIRFWWSRLTGVEQTQFGIELYFDKRDWSELQIPWKAFDDDEQRREFLDLAIQHIHASRSQIAT